MRLLQVAQAIAALLAIAGSGCTGERSPSCEDTYTTINDGTFLLSPPDGANLYPDLPRADVILRDGWQGRVELSFPETDTGQSLRSAVWTDALLAGDEIAVVGDYQRQVRPCGISGGIYETLYVTRLAQGQDAGTAR